MSQNTLHRDVRSVAHSPAHAATADSAGQAAGCIHTLFEAQARARAAAPAVRWRGETVAYGELDARASRLARHLQSLGVGPEVPVGVCLPRTPDLIVALLAVLKAGGAYVPLDPAYPADRIEHVIADTRVPVLVTDTGTAARLPASAARVVRIDAEGDAIAAHPSTAPVSSISPENLAYVIYTSGSTGRPKGVQIEHRSTVAVLRWMRGALSDAERASVLASTSVCFDVSIAEIFGTLCWGGTLVLVDHALALAGADGVATACMVPTAAAELLRSGGIPACIDTLALGGEPLRNELAQELYALGHVRRVLNLYGPTEDTTYSTCKEVEPGRAETMTVGRPVTGTVARVLDAELRLVPPGEAGEVWMSGAGVSRGYFRAPGMTAERFRPDPHGAPGSRMYRTGDLGRWRADGDLDCLGRVDHQVKVRGFRVEPGEIEAALRAHPGVREALVKPWGGDGATRLAAYVVPADGAAPPAHELRDHLRARLPDYMVPEAFVALEELPRTPNGKVDRLALPEPRPERDVEAEYVAPRTQAETALADIWSRVLGVERVGVRDDFFQLGGHSLLAAQIAARVREELGAELPLTTLFSMPTVQELAPRVAAAAGTERSIPPAPRDRPLPLSFPQEAVWFFHQLSPGMRSYNFQATVRVRGRLEVEPLRRALGEIVRRHEIFRTTFREEESGPVQVIHDPWTVDLPVVDLSARSADEREREMRRMMRDEFLRPFDLAALPLVRWTLFRLGDGEHVLLCVEQHLVHDGWSFGVFLRELQALYSAYVQGRPSPLPPLAVQFADFAAWHRAWMQGEEAREQLAWWAGHLRGVPPVLELPGDRPRPAAMSFRGSSLRVALPPDVWAEADRFSRAHGVTLFMTLFAAFQALLHRYTGETDFCVGSGVAARRMRQAEDLVGMIVNTIPLRADVSGDPTFAGLVERVRAEAVQAFARQDVPFAEIVAAVHPERSRGHLPVFQVAFNFHHAPYPEMRVPGAELEVEEGLGNESSKFDLNIICIPRAHQGAGEEVVMIWEFNADLFDESTVRRMIAHYRGVLASALADPAERVGRLRIASDEAEQAVLEGAETPYPRDATLHALFREHARRDPSAVAIDHGGRAWTYGELDAAGERIARRLRSLGVAAEQRVGIALQRSPEMVAALLGVLKAGCTCLPLDPDYPAERLEWMVEDADARIVLVRDALPPALAGYAGTVVSMDGITADAEDARDGDSSTEARPRVFAESLAYIVYTSGSTGRPKGSGSTHQGTVRLCRDAGYVALGPADAVAQTAALSFDAATWEIWAALTNGARLVLVDRDDLLSPPRLTERIGSAGVTTLFLTTALFNQVTAEAPHAFAGLRTLLFGGEAGSAAAARRAAEATEARVLNMYGPSENATYSSWYDVRRLSPDAASVPIGGPVAHTRLPVLDAAMRPVPAGVAGELYVGGDGLARGYLGRPGLTAERFVPDPSPNHPGERLYRTGDRARLNADGAIEFLGRVDNQVKVRGFRVEPDEVEAALRASPLVAEAAVVAREDVPGDRYLAAYVLPAAGGLPPAPHELRDHLAARLPAYMLPSAYVVVDALPRTPSGKLDRRALPAPAAWDVPREFVAPKTPAEQALAEIWRDVLGVERVGVDDDFFELGGHSLRATRMLARVHQKLGVRLPVSELFDHPTVRGLAARLDNSGPSDRAA